MVVSICLEGCCGGGSQTVEPEAERHDTVTAKFSEQMALIGSAGPLPPTGAVGTCCHHRSRQTRLPALLAEPANNQHLDGTRWPTTEASAGAKQHVSEARRGLLVGNRTFQTRHPHYPTRSSKLRMSQVRGVRICGSP